MAAVPQLHGVWRGGELEKVTRHVLPTGHAALDRELPGGGWPVGALSEVLHDSAGIGEVRLLSGALAQAAGEGRLVAWIDPPHLPYAPALAQSGVPLECCLVVRPLTHEDALWAAEQALRSGACGAVLLWPERQSRRLDYAWLRRLQMASAAGRAMAVLFRSSAAASQSTPAHLRIALAVEDGALTLRIPKRRGPPLTQPVVLHALDRPRTALAPAPARRARPHLAFTAPH